MGRIIENVSRIRQIMPSAREPSAIRRCSFADALARLWDAHKSSNSVSQADASTNMPCHRARGRRGHAHAVGAAEGVACAGRTIAAGACADGCKCCRDRQSGRRRWSGPWRGGDRSVASSRQRRRFSSNGNGAALRMRYFRPPRRSASGADDVLVIFADTPLVRAETLSKLRRRLPTELRWQFSVSSRLTRTVTDGS